VIPPSVEPRTSIRSAFQLFSWAARVPRVADSSLRFPGACAIRTLSILTVSSCCAIHRCAASGGQGHQQSSFNDLVFVVSVSRVSRGCSDTESGVFTNLCCRTTEPPKLDVKHPLRHNFTRYGTHAAKHPVITLLISLTVASILIYPFPFLYTNNFTNGASNLPHHVWTSAQPFDGGGNTRADVVMRSIWVHGMVPILIDGGASFC
jgi:hypothetical protein